MKNAYIVLIAIPAIAGIAGVAYMMQGSESGSITTTGLYDGASPVLGSSDAPITIVEWGDYQCEFCHRFHSNTLGSIRTNYVDTGKVNIVFRDFVLNGPDSAMAAHATHCAEDQGMFWEYHDALYDNWGGERTGWITRDSLLALAVSTGIDTEEFSSCMDSNAHSERVSESVKYGKSVGVDSTPTFLVSNGEDVIKIRGAQPYDVFVRAIESL